MPNDQSIREAVKFLSINNDCPDEDCKECHNVRILLNLATAYLNVQGFPEEREIHPMYTNRTTDITTWEQYDIGFNEALHLAKLSQMKKFEGLEKILTEHNISHGQRGYMPSYELICQMVEKALEFIRQHMGGK